MKPDEYLNQILKDQALTQGELEELRSHRTDVQSLLEEYFTNSNPSIQYAGSYRKKTMIRDSYDLDVVCYFPHGDDGSGDNLSEIYDSTHDALSECYHVERKTSALRIMEKGALVTRQDYRIDVVAGRYTGDDKSDVFLHQEGVKGSRLKTNLQTHVDHIRDSGVRRPIKLLKLWKYQRGIPLKTFILELLVVKLLQRQKNATLSNQLIYVLTEFAEKVDSLAVEDPANSNNDLQPLLDKARSDISTWAALTLGYIKNGDWESVLGKIPDKEIGGSGVSQALHGIAASSVPNRPWCP